MQQYACKTENIYGGLYNHETSLVGAFQRGLSAICGSIITLSGLFVNCFVAEQHSSHQSNLGADTSFPAKALGPGLDREKYILAAFVVPKSRLEPLSCTSLKASRNIWL